MIERAGHVARRGFRPIWGRPERDSDAVRVTIINSILQLILLTVRNICSPRVLYILIRTLLGH
jgi:hypothetical protein